MKNLFFLARLIWRIVSIIVGGCLILLAFVLAWVISSYAAGWWK